MRIASRGTFNSQATNEAALRNTLLPRLRS